VDDRAPASAGQRLERDGRIPLAGELASDRQAQPGAGRTAAPSTSAVESLEDLLFLARSRAGALVGDLDVVGPRR
jgi:hypothetical protein